MVALFDLRFFFQGEGGEVKDCGVECGLHRHELELWLVSTGDTFLGYGEIHNLTRLGVLGRQKPISPNSEPRNPGILTYCPTF